MTAMTDGLVAAYLFIAACLIALVCVVAKIRDLDQRAEERRRIRDAAAWEAHVAAAVAQSETPIYDATIAHIAAHEAATLDREWADVAEGRWGA